MNNHLHRERDAALLKFRQAAPAQASAQKVSTRNDVVPIIFFHFTTPPTTIRRLSLAATSHCRAEIMNNNIMTAATFLVTGIMVP